jgi:nitroreductase
MNLATLLTRNRSYRRFQESQSLDRETLEGLVEYTRLCSFSGNRQPLKYLLSHTPERNAQIFPHLRWAAGLPDWHGPAEGERPAAYIVVLGDLEIASDFNVDCGIAGQAILLAAAEHGLGGCMIGSCDRDGLHRSLHIPAQFVIVMVIAVGKPLDTVVLEDAKSRNEIAYWRDAKGVHHVPKRPLAELLVEFDLAETPAMAMASSAFVDACHNDACVGQAGHRD